VKPELKPATKPALKPAKLELKAAKPAPLAAKPELKPTKSQLRLTKPEPKPAKPELKLAKPEGKKPEGKKLEPPKPALKAKPETKPASAPKAAEPQATPSEAPPSRKPRKSIKEAAGVSSEAVARRTGKSWDDWFEVLESAGAATLDQRGVIAILAQKHGIGPWWQQMIAVGYESLRGKQDKTAKSDRPAPADGFRINSSCTLDAPLPRVFRLWNDAGERARWLADDRFVVRGATADKVIRARWGKGSSQVAVSFSEKSGRTEVSVEHLQIESQGAADQMKAYWAKKLGLLDRALAPRTR
jgi:hypothetical protein